MEKTPSAEATRQALDRAAAVARPQPESTEVQLALLKKDVEDLKATSGKKWYDLVAIAIGLFAGALALPRAVVDLNHVITDSPRTTVHWDGSLDVSYSPTDRNLQMVVPLSINNEGQQTEEVRDVTAIITIPASSAANPIPIDGSNIQVREGTASVPHSFYVKSEENRTISIFVDVPAPGPDRLLAGRQKKQLDMTLILRGGKRKVTQSFCFDFAKEDYEDEAASKDKHFYNPDC